MVMVDKCRPVGINMSLFLVHDQWGLFQLQSNVSIIMDQTSINTVNIKAALINMPILTMSQITMCNMKIVTHSDKPIENYQPLLQFQCP